MENIQPLIDRIALLEEKLKCVLVTVDNLSAKLTEVTTFAHTVNNARLENVTQIAEVNNFVDAVNNARLENLNSLTAQIAGANTFTQQVNDAFLLHKKWHA